MLMFPSSILPTFQTYRGHAICHCKLYRPPNLLQPQPLRWKPDRLAGFAQRFAVLNAQFERSENLRQPVLIEPPHNDGALVKVLVLLTLNLPPPGGEQLLDKISFRDRHPHLEIAEVGEEREIEQDIDERQRDGGDVPFPDGYNPVLAPALPMNDELDAEIFPGELPDAGLHHDRQI